MASKNIAELVIHHVITVTDEELSRLTVTILARAFGVDRYKLSRQFKRHTKMTLEAYLFKEKMVRAAFLLKFHQQIKVKDVSDKIGFCNCDYFIKRFKQYYGIAPGKYSELKSNAS